MESSMGRRKYAAVGTMDKSGRVKKQMGGIVPDMSGVDERIGEIDEVAIAQTLPMYGEYGEPVSGQAWDSSGVPRTQGYIPQHPEDRRTSSQRLLQQPPTGMRGGGMPRGYRKGGMATMPSSNTTVRGPYGGKATSKNTNMHKLNAMGKLKGQ